LIAILLVVFEWSLKMVALAKSFSKATGLDVDVDILKMIAIFSAGGLAVSLMRASYGLDLSFGFF
jgi:hypothetical protein